MQTLLATLLSLHLMYKLKEKYAGGQQCPVLHSNDHRNPYRVKQLWELDSRQFALIPQGGEFIAQSASWYKTGLFEYSPGVFRELCMREGIAEEELALSFCPNRNMRTMKKHAGNKGGRSDAFIYFTFDRKYIIKTMKKSEIETIRKSLRALNVYYSSRDGRHSLLAKFFGAFTLYFQGRSAIHIAVLENIIPAEARVKALFDLKGSKVNRQALTDPTIISLSRVDAQTVLKDLDFTQVFGTMPVLEPYYRYLHSQLLRDSETLRMLNLMDYSLLLAVCMPDEPDDRHSHRIIKVKDPSFVYYVGVIDYMQKYTVRKKIETSKNRMVSPRTPMSFHSCVHPLMYAERFRNFLLELLPCE